MRGDRPTMNELLAVDKRATPHARGSTLIPKRPLVHAEGYPACAGIDRLTIVRYPQTAWLPRMRGDRPCSGPPRQGLGRATPHARGSTLNRPTRSR